MNDEEEVRPATIADFREEGRRNGLKAAEAFGSLCIGPDQTKLMSPEMWWRVHEEDVLPATLARMKDVGASEDEINAYKDALNAELDQYCMNCAQLGLLGISATSDDLTVDDTRRSISLASLNKHSTLSACALLGATHGKQEAIENSLRAQYRGFDFVIAQQLKTAHQRVQDLYALGLSEAQVNAYVNAITSTATEEFKKILKNLELASKVE